MLKKIILLLLIVFLNGCNKEDDVSNEQITQPQALSSGIFEPTSGINVMGSATIYKNGTQRNVTLTNFSISEGPDLKVYLSTTNVPNTFISLGDLTSATTYTIPQETDLNVYTYVLIHCETYNHLYAIASLEE
ncbi:DM13 domain-containing protein [Flavobacterium sp. J27]|uniref:DM13 domain-containing protein n=1 Tax=Flavobacterium sp. J27 TaxID=2060419 RepID=UPI0010326C95|nr:DM13 domain-containing protein [Flavobacterium sp. J27]